jgi:hypothetical protein
MPAVKIFVFLDLAQNASFLRQKHISTLSVAFATGCEAPGLKANNQKLTNFTNIKPDKWLPNLPDFFIMATIILFFGFCSFNPLN